MTVQVTRLRAETRHDTDAVPTPSPRLSWTVGTDAADWMQASVEIRLDEEVTVIEGRESVLVTWPFAPIAAGSRHEVRVRVTGCDGVVSDWSEPLAIRAAFLRYHRDLIDAGWWQSMQAAVRADAALPEVLSYPDAIRFAH